MDAPEDDPPARRTIADLDLKIGLIRQMCHLTAFSEHTLLTEMQLDHPAHWVSKVTRGDQAIEIFDLRKICASHDKKLRARGRAPKSGPPIVTPNLIAAPFEEFWSGLDEALAAQADPALLPQMRREAAAYVFSSLETKGVKRRERDGGAQLAATISDVKPPAQTERFFDATTTPDARPEGAVYADGTFSLSIPVREAVPHRLWLFAIRNLAAEVVLNGVRVDDTIVEWSPDGPYCMEVLPSANGEPDQPLVRLRNITVRARLGPFMLRALAIPADIGLDRLKLDSRGALAGVEATWRFLRSVESARRDKEIADRVVFATTPYHVITAQAGKAEGA